MKPAAGLADDGFVSALRIAGHDFVRLPMLHALSGSGTFEDEVSHSRRNLTDRRDFSFDPGQSDRRHEADSKNRWPGLVKCGEDEAHPQTQGAASRSYSLSVIRIKPSPVTTGPLAVTMT